MGSPGLLEPFRLSIKEGVYVFSPLPSGALPSPRPPGTACVGWSPLKISLFQLSAWGLFKVPHKQGALLIKGKTQVFAL